MDRSYLSQPEVVAASRRFVCIRLLTYEDAAENAFVKSFEAFRSGEVENTVFCLLAPDGRTRLVRPARGTQMFGDAADMAAAMGRIARRFEPKPAAGAPDLPPVAD